MIIGYGHGNRVRRWGSITPMINDAGSDGSALSSSSSEVEEEAYPRGDVFEGWGLSWALCVRFLCSSTFSFSSLLA